jgi:hypothetical protein
MNQSSTAPFSPDGNHSHQPIMTPDLSSFFHDGNLTSLGMSYLIHKCKAVYQENQQMQVSLTQCLVQTLGESVVQSMGKSKTQRLMQALRQAIQESEPQSSKFSKVKKNQ